MNQPFQDSSHSDQPNIYREMGLDDTARRMLWDGTRQAIEADGLKLEGELGGGASAKVFAARENATGRKLAVKVILDPANARSLQLFHREHKILASEYVPADIVPHFVFGRDEKHAADSQPYLVMEQIEGRKIHDYAKEAGLSVERKIDLAEQMFRAFDRLHSCNLVHGDPSPNNVLVEAGDRVRLIDFGVSRRLQSGYASISSITGPGGTPGFATDARMLGEDKASVQTDLYGAAAVAFHLFVGSVPEPHQHAEEALQEQLTRARVPQAIAGIIVHGLRTKDKTIAKDEDDPRLFPSAKTVVDAIVAWRKEVAESIAVQQRAQERRRQRNIHVIVLLAIVVPLAIFGGWSYGKYLELQHSQQQRAVSALQSEVTRVTNSAHPAVRAKLAEKELLFTELHRAETAGEMAAARDAQVKLIAAMRATLETSRSLERFIPLRESLGIVLRKMPWVTSSPTIKKEQERLEREYLALGEQLDRGELETTAQSLTTLQRDLAELATRNITAASADQARSQLEQEQDSLTGRVRKLDGFQPVATLAGSARQAWESGDFSQASTLFGQARQKLTEALPLLETAEEKSERETKQTARLREDATRLRKQLAATASERDTQLARVRELEGQIAQAAKQNLDDRAALKAAQARAEELSGKIKPVPPCWPT